MRPESASSRTELDEQGSRLVWIFGSSRSGSTWLLRMIAEAAGVVPIDDPHLGHHLGVWRPIPLAWAAAEEVPDLNTLLEVKREQPGYFFAERYRHAWWEPLRDLIRARFEAQAAELAAAERQEATYVVKEPGSQASGLLAELFPQSKLIFLLRDGRDVVDSWLDAYRAGSWAIEGGAFPVASWGRLPLIRWLSSVWVYRTREVRRALMTRRPEDQIVVRYEDLRSDAAAVLARILEMTGLDPGPGGVARIAERHAFERAPEQDRGSGMEMRSAAPGSWRSNLSEMEKLAMHDVMGDALAELGYPPQGGRPAPLSEVAVQAARPPGSG